MAIYEWAMSGNPSRYKNRLEVTESAPDYAANTRTISWSLYLVSYDNRYPAWNTSNNGSRSVTIAGETWASSFGFDFRPASSTKVILLASGTKVITHNASGYATISISSSLDSNNQYVGSGGGSTSLALTRISQVPQAPGGLTPGATSPTTVALSWTTPDDGGAALTGYEVQYATDAGYSTGLGSQAFTGNSGTVTGLTPGAGYHFRVRAENARGWGSYSATVTASPALPAPTLNSWLQNGSGGLVANWSAPDPATGLTGYRLQVAQNPGFTVGVVLIDVGNVLTATATGLAGGRTYYARVAARTSGGVNTYSTARDVQLILSSGDLDGWTRLGTKPAQISYYTAEGIRRDSNSTAQLLILESFSTASVTIAADTFGIGKTVTGLTVAKTYRFEALASLNGSPLASDYRLKIISEATGTSTTVTTSTELPYIEFVADSTSVVFQILLAQSVTVIGAQDHVEAVSFHRIRVLELATDYPQRLQSTVYESNLANHFDMACNSVGATWYVAKDGVTRFLLPGTALPVSAVFTDDATPGAMSYVDIVAGYDTLSTVNRIEATNYAVDAAGENEANTTVIAEDTTSQNSYGVHSVYFDLNLWTTAPYDESFTNRLAALLAAHSEPELLISGFKWNAQQDLALANALEVGDRLTVKYRGIVQDSQIVALTHTITPTRWMVTFDLQSI
jgi:hypothetical protein